MRRAKKRAAPSPVQAKSGAPKPKYDPVKENLEPHKPGEAVKRYTRAEVDKQTDAVKRCLVVGVDERGMRRELQREGLNLSMNRVRMLKARVHEQMKLEDERTKPMARAKQLIRLHEELKAARGVPDPCFEGSWVVKPNWGAVTRLETLIASIQGNFEPIKLDIDVVHREALTNVLTSITPEQAIQLMTSYDKLASLAAAAAHARGEKLPPLLPSPTKRESTVFTQGAENAAE